MLEIRLKYVFWNDKTKPAFFNKCATMLFILIPTIAMSLYIIFDIDSMSYAILENLFLEILVLKFLLILTAMFLVLLFYRSIRDILILLVAFLILVSYFCIIPLASYNNYKSVNTGIHHIKFNITNLPTVIDSNSHYYISSQAYCSTDANCDIPVYRVSVQPTVGNNVRIYYYPNMGKYPEFYSKDISVNKLSIESDAVIFN